ncbi:unnamed protein product [Microthlaspi erraticum]|uniref:Coenzyme PQQ synthesis protein F-like C-terminal lobe domain-containing protein n=1 Tax=Microthlaspi erraticum TaxID=1685480 RepID=A0A6D2IJ08_9BRAS|nr:unnamed protein product [Microthlaspi erraticum]CAA7051776.1 unnamed protein product [Microthlaspi erraticum]
MKSFKPSLEQFEVSKEKLFVDLHPTNLTEHADQLFMESMEEKKALDVISFADIQKYTSGISFSDLHVQGIIFGLISREEAEIVANLLDKHPCTISRNVVALLPSNGRRRIDSRVRNDSDVNSLSKVFYQIPCIGLVQFFFSLMEKRFYHQLSVVESLCYDADCQIQTQGIRGICLAVISPRHGPDYLLKRICSFIDTFKIDRQTFDKHKEAAMNILDDNCGSRIGEFVIRAEYSEDLFSEARKSLDALTFEEVRSKFLELFGANSSRVEVCIWGCNTEPPEGCV